MLELGPGAGALILRTPPELDGTEIEISSAGDESVRTHSLVRPRHVDGATQYAAVYPDLRPGEYTVGNDRNCPAVTVTITGGSITVAEWPRR
jgi:hypothetical protein